MALQELMLLVSQLQEQNEAGRLGKATYQHLNFDF